MQDFILSSRTNVPCLEARGANNLRKTIELYGMYLSYCYDKIDDDFEKYYLDRRNKYRWHYVNIGINNIYKKLNKKYIGYDEKKYHISKYSLRKYGNTYYIHRVIVYEGTYVVIEKLLSLIMLDEDLKEVYLKYLHEEMIKDFMTFQYDCLREFIGGEQNTKSTYYNINVVNKIIELLKKY